MAYEDIVPEKIRSMGQRVDERLALCQAIADSFEREGADGVEDELGKRMDRIHDEFDGVFAVLEDML